MNKNDGFYVSLLLGSILSIILWISFFGWIKILLTEFHRHKDLLIHLL